ncbi:MAG: hypothetical protein U0359_08720 [Byssovorax sp.]
MSVSRASLLLAALVGAGCSAPVVDDVSDASSGMTEGVVVVERSSSADGPTQSNISAKFMHLGASADPDLAERLVGLRLDLPAPGRCLSMPGADVAGVQSPGSLAALGPIELLDVGDVTVHIKPVPGEPSQPAMALAARAFPDVGDLVSGVFYTSRDAASDLPGGTTYVLEGSGNLDRWAGSTGAGPVERFSIEAEAPPAPDDVRVGDAALADGAQLDEGAPVLVRWHAGDRAKSDQILVDLRSAGGDAVRCAFEDSGEASVPASVLESKLLAGPGPLTLAFHRIRRRPLGAPALTGIDAGEVRFDLSIVGRATIVRRAP